MDDIEKECSSVVEEICEKFGYDSKDKEDSDSLKTVLKRAIYLMCKDSSKKDRDLLYQMLKHTPIAVVDKIDEETYKKLEATYIGNPNPHVINTEDSSMGEYGKHLGDGAYVSEPVLDESLNVVGKKSFIYIQKAQGKIKKLFGTDINVQHLIHELGHAWNAEKDQYTITKDGMLHERIGAVDILYSLTNEDGKTVKKQESTSNLIIEEGLNTVYEENTMAEYLGVSLEEMREIYMTTLHPSNYQGYIADFVRYMMQELGTDDFRKWRMSGDTESKYKIEKLLRRTDWWKTRRANPSQEITGLETTSKKREIIEANEKKSEKMKMFFEEYNDVFFPEESHMTPFESIDNSLMQYYNMKASMICYKMSIDDYTQLLKHISNDIYPLVNQSSLIKLKDDLKSSIGKVSLYTLSEMSNRIHDQEEFLKRTNQGEIR